MTVTAPALRPRILAALRLGYPLSSTDLQRMLLASEGGIRYHLRRLMAAGQVRARGQPYRYELSTGDKK